MLTYRTVRASIVFSSVEIGSFLETNSILRNASDSVKIFLKSWTKGNNTEEPHFILSPCFLYVLWWQLCCRTITVKMLHNIVSLQGPMIGPPCSTTCKKSSSFIQCEVMSLEIMRINEKYVWMSFERIACILAS